MVPIPPQQQPDRTTAPEHLGANQPIPNCLPVFGVVAVNNSCYVGISDVSSAHTDKTAATLTFVVCRLFTSLGGMGRGQERLIRERQELCQNPAVAKKQRPGHSTAEPGKEGTAMFGKETGLEISAPTFLRLQRETTRLSMPCRTGSEMFAAGYVLLRCLSWLSALWKGCKSPAPTRETKHGDLDFGYVSSSRTVLSAAVSKQDPPRHAVFPCLYEEPTISNSRHCLSSLHAQLFPFLPSNRC